MKREEAPAKPATAAVPAQQEHLRTAYALVARHRRRPPGGIRGFVRLIAPYLPVILIACAVAVSYAVMTGRH